MDPVATIKDIFLNKNGVVMEQLIAASEDDLFGVGQHGAIFYILENLKGLPDDNLIIDILYDGEPAAKFDLMRGTDFPVGARTWPDWFTVPRYAKYRKPGVHIVQIKVGKRKIAQILRGRDFSPEKGGYTSPVFVFSITPGKPGTD